MKKALIAKIFYDIRASYWFIPACLVLLAIAGALGALALDRSGWTDDALRFLSFPTLGPDGMRTVLSVIAQSVIGVAGVMFSITMVAVSHASGQFGPRLIGNFMRDRGNQWSLGILIATFVFALIALRNVSGEGPEAGVDPNLTLTVALLLALVSVCTMIYYVHHVPETINVANISSALGKKLIAALKATADDPSAPRRVVTTGTSHRVRLATAGYVQQIDVPELDRIARHHGLAIEVAVRPGAFVTPFTCIATLDRDAEKASAAVKGCFALGRERTEDQDLTFLAQQQVEMVARALSPGINDPYTAMSCLNWLAAALAAADESGTSFGLSGTGAVTFPPLGWSDLLALTFGESWDYVKHDRLACTRWRSLLDELRDNVRPENAAALARFRAEMEASDAA